MCVRVVLVTFWGVCLLKLLKEPALISYFERTSFHSSGILLYVGIHCAPSQIYVYMMYVYVYIYIYIYDVIYVCMYVCMYV